MEDEMGFIEFQLLRVNISNIQFYIYISLKCNNLVLSLKLCVWSYKLI